ncbi:MULTISPECIES: molybdopterin-dependent oxidoreductase [Mycobacterium avium complex (MAC)]|uniref:Molybdopterin-dependent oxidoreductase n=2 Tax=Mycobacterium intracellulare TaxID=1767 RepID=A0AAE4RF58_MYCIT|nr:MULTISPECIES: molybdopterin-dependent oxidoreductase [Mycobacterium avium complex (MAC)]MCA2319676.1 molybdopterin-dependent oxidoreductase [Mycobacterium intracellulare]MCA2340189.1 molybdopterin-dependent oxidoreductase [Mycobacterium intracellulare]MDV6976384.1 molybdopterin-dependent oxidoreductase [Mycobacterium intracellulare]MDV6981437.1 molybdopterin-dependent oxidoreductase [Mycobacterium intracellulare]MDV7014671.1 molybdopterin-dependent oxidoreductase [Mycobacterium intracellula
MKPGEDGRHLRTCPLCEAMCGLEIQVDDGRVTGIRGNRDDVWSRGHLCPKGTSLAALHDDPDRIREPMIKVDGQWHEVSWDAAFRRCTELLTPVIDKYGIGAVTAYTGNPLAHSFSLARYAGVLMGMSGMPVTYSPGTVDQWPKNLSSHLMYGLWWNFPVPDIERTDLLVIMGANPAASQGSLLAAPNVMGLIDAIRKRGKVIVIDPVRTPTAARADEWLPIVPGTDAALLLAVAHTLFAEDLARPGPHLAGHLDGLDTLRRVVADWPPERVGAVTGIGEDRIRRLARELAGTDKSVVYGRIGLCNQEFGSLASWLVDVVNILTGHFDTPGGAMFPRPAAWSITTQPLPGLEGGAPEFGRWHTRVRGAKEVLGQAPVSCMAEEIATPGDGQLKALITVAGNPVLSTPGGDKLDEVLPMLEAMISVDLWLNETTRHADVILPGLSPLEQPHHDDLILLFAIHSIANYSAPVFDPGDRPHEWEILIRLTGLCTGTPAEDVDVAAIDDGFFDYLAFTRGLDGAEIRKLYEHGGPERMLDLTLRTGPFGDQYGKNPGGLTLDTLKANPNGIDFGPMVPQLPDILGTPDKKIRLAPQYLLDDLPRLAARMERPAEPLVLVSRRHLRSNNTWLHNVPALMKGKDRCTLLIHPDDAARCGIADNDIVTVKSEAGEIRVPVEITDAIKPGVVSMPHGWGHGKPGTRMTVANGSPGANTNVLSPPTFVDQPSGNGVLNGIPVTIIDDQARFRPAQAL